jgi:site-specific recombinase XerD
VGQSTVNRELTVIKGLFRRAVEWKMIAASPAADVRKYRTDDVRARVLTEAEIQTVLTKTPADIALLCRSTLECLPRLSELLTLRREHIGPSWVEIRRKGGRVERITITPELREALLKRAHRKGYVFGTGTDGEPPTQEATSLAITRMMRKVGLRGVSHHTMRHTGVTLMLEAGVNPRVIQKLAGWTSLRMLERYGHARDAEAQRAVTTMHALLERATNASDDQAVTTSAPTSVATSFAMRAHTRGTALIVQHTRCRCKCFGLSGVPNGRLRFVLARPEGRHAPTGGVEWRRRRLGSLPSRSLARRRRHSSPKDRLCQRAALEADLAANEAAVRRLIAAIATGSLLGWTKDLPDESFRYRNPRPALDIDDLDHFASRVSEIRFTTRRESARRDYFVIQYSKLSTSA